MKYSPLTWSPSPIGSSWRWETFFLDLEFRLTPNDKWWIVDAYSRGDHLVTEEFTSLDLAMEACEKVVRS